MPKLKRLVLDVLKPHEPGIIEISKEISSLSGVEGANISIYEIDKDVENAKITVEGNNLDFSAIEKLLEENGATVHSVDEAVAGKRIVVEKLTPQER